jgi:hypothetical protein
MVGEIPNDLYTNPVSEKAHPLMFKVGPGSSVPHR